MVGSEHDCSKLFQRFVKEIIDNQVVELRVMFYLVDGIAHTAANILFVIAAPLQTLFQGCKRRRQDKDTDGIPDMGTRLLRSLPVYFQDDVLPPAN